MSKRKYITFEEYEQAWAELKRLPAEAFVTGEMFCLVHGGIAMPTLRKYIREGVIPPPIKDQRVNRLRCWPAGQVRSYFKKLADAQQNEAPKKRRGRPRNNQIGPY